MKTKLIHLAFVLAPLAPSPAASIYTAGHGDVGIAYEDGALDPHVHIHDGSLVDGAPVNNPPDGVEFGPDEVVIFVSDPSVARPVGIQWDFLGVSAGAPLWVLPQAEDPGKPFLGIASEELASSDWTVLSLSLTSMNAPVGADFSLYQTDGFGAPVIQFATSDGITGADTYNMIVGGHAHYNWAFTEPGLYEIEFTVTGTHATDGPKSASGLFTFGVTQVPEPGSAAFAFLSIAAVLRRRRP